MYITCLDLEGVLVPEIWIEFAEAAGIPELKKTTNAVNQIPTTGQAARKKCKERELLKLAYWKINRPK